MEEGVNPIHEQRLLVFLEDIDRGVFNQVLVGAEQFKKISDAMIVEEWDDSELKRGFRVARIRLGGRDIPADTFIGCESITPGEHLAEADKNQEDE